MNKILINSFVVCVLISASSYTYAKAAVKKSTVEMKCYVSVLGGEELIHFVNSNKTSLTELAQLLKGNSIFTSRSKQKKEIYQVKECVPLQEKFKNAIAQQIDDNTVR